MTVERWLPRTDYTRREQILRRRLTRTGKLFGFLRDCRRELFNDDFQAELESMYRDTGAGHEPVPPALLAMAVLLQAYEGVSDAEAVEMTTAAPSNGRTVTSADSEFLQQRLRKLTKTRTGRARVRERVAVEHSLAHLSRRQGRRARYRGVRNNLFDVRRAAAVQNLEIVHRRVSANGNHQRIAA
jgi:hypothetical protein